MKNKLYIVDSILLFKPNNIDKESDYISLENVSNTLNFSKYDVLIFYTYNIYTILSPYKKVSILYGIAFKLKKLLYIKDNFQNEIKVDVIYLFKLGYKYLFDYLSIKYFKKVIFNEINNLETLKSSKKFLSQSQKSVVIYLKMSGNFGIMSGGEVSHSSGVINSLKNFYNNIIVFTTDYIHVSKNRILVENIILKKFNNFFEMGILYLNISTYKLINKRIENCEKSFIYQRHNFFNYLGVKLSIKYNIPLVLEFNSLNLWTAQNWGGGIPENYRKLLRKIELLNLKKADLITCVSEELKNFLIKIGVDQEKVLVNVNGVDIIKYSPEINGVKIRNKYFLKDKIVIGFVGSFDIFHGVPVLLKAYNNLVYQYPDYKEKVRMILIGEGKILTNIKKQLKICKLEDMVILAGAIDYDKVPRYLAACDILVAPHVPNKDGSPFFGSPTKLFEYMAMGKAIVASNLGQIGRVLENKKTALLVKPGDANDLMLAINELINNEPLRISLGNSAREEVTKKYTWDVNVKNIINKLEELYRRNVDA